MPKGGGTIFDEVKVDRKAGRGGNSEDVAPGSKRYNRDGPLLW